MSFAEPFYHYFVQEATRKRSLASLNDADLNALSKINQKTPVPLVKDSRLTEKGNILKVYLSTKDSENYYAKFEQFIQSLHKISGQVVFEVIGNSKNIETQFYGSNDSLEVINSSLQSCFSDSASIITFPCLNFAGKSCYDFCPDAPFYKGLTGYEEFIVSPLYFLINLFQTITWPTLGVYQVLFSPLPADIHSKVIESVDCEWRALLEPDGKVTPSLQLTSVNKRLEYKNPEYKSHFAVNVRIILPYDKPEPIVNAFISNYLYGAKAFLIKKTRSQRLVEGMINDRYAFRSGWVLNSHELASFLHFPLEYISKPESKQFYVSVPAGDKPQYFTKYTGPQIGEWVCGNITEKVFLPDQKERPHVHIMGVPRMGKSVLLSQLAINKLLMNESVFLIDPHGDLVENTLKMVPAEYMDKVIWISFGLDDYTPLLTIKENLDLRYPGKVSDDLSANMREISSTHKNSQWFGPRMSYAFQCAFFIYCSMPELDLTDIRQMLSRTKKGAYLRKTIYAKVKNPVIRNFLDEIQSSSYESLAPVIVRLSHLLLDEKSLRFFTQSQNKISIQDIMQTGKLCLIDLSCGIIGRQRSAILAGVFDSLITNNILARASEDYLGRRACTLLKDEFYSNPGDLDMQLSQLSKYNLSVIFAHQYLDQVEDQAREVMPTAATQVMFKLRYKDAEIMSRDFNIPPEEFSSLNKFEAIIKCDEVIKIRTALPKFLNPDFSTQIKKRCIEKYYARHEAQIEKKLEIDEV